ncbi:MAG: cadherin-like beta sandwich domain-containing protein [Bacilli bacterium]|nr:cadherin-like beta sandwich domain-containing protein [Bacilli bacterium]
MKKINIILTIFLSFLFVGNVKAASAKITVSPASKTILVGNTITVTVTTSSTSTLGAVSYTVQYNSNILSLTSTTSPTGGARTVGYFNSKGNTTISYTYTFKAISSGNATISIVGAEAGDDNGTALSVTSSSASIKVMTQAQLQATYSGNNYLSGLSIEGYELDPAFNRDTLEYNVTLKPETENVIISATKEDSTASITGAGEIAVSEGANTISIDVVAQNGNVRTYVINAVVEEYDPINVTVDGKNYTIVRSTKTLEFNNNLFTATKENITGEEVPAFYNEITDTTLIALKDEEGKVEYFIYKDDNYKKFNELKLGSVDLMVLSTNDIPTEYKNATITVNEKEYGAYKLSDTSRFSLIYGTNLTNNNTGLYVYDNLENTLQRYDADMVNNMTAKIDKLTKTNYILIFTSAGLLILLIVALIPKKPKSKSVDEQSIEETPVLDIDQAKEEPKPKKEKKQQVKKQDKKKK